MKPTPDGAGGAVASPTPDHDLEARVGPTDPDEAQDAAESPEPLASPPSSVLGRLQASYARSQSEAGERRLTAMILPARFESLLAVRFRPIPWDNQRRRIAAAQKQGGGKEAELDFAAGIIAEACDEILLRDPEDGELKPMVEVVADYAGQPPVRFDTRLLDAVGAAYKGTLRGKGVVRVLYQNPSALNMLFGQLQAWLNEETEGDDALTGEADEEDGADRPT